ncbi:MAG: hypothetical protein ACRDTC_26035 [Pseudonocardiaceae bacterium]
MVVAAGIAVAMGMAPAVGLPSGTIGAGAPPASTMIKAQTKTTKVKANLDGVKVRWQRKGYRVNLHGDPAFDCAAHSYGQVHDFFISHRCEFVLRATGEFHDKNRNVVLVAFSWVEMPMTGEAVKLKKLVDTEGTGNITELSREQGRYRAVRFTGLGYHSGHSEQGVWNVQVQPVGWSPAAALINEISDEVIAAGIENT